MYNCTCLSLCLTLSLFLSPHPATIYVCTNCTCIYLNLYSCVKVKTKMAFPYTKIFSFTEIWNFRINVDSAHISAKPLTKIFVFVNTFENILNFCKNILFMSWPSCPLCPPHGKLSVRLVKSVLSRLFCLSCPVPDVRSRLFCPGCPDPSVLSLLSCPSCPATAAMTQQHCLQLSWRRCPALLSCPGTPVQAHLSRLTCQANLWRLTCPGCPVLLVLSSMSCSTCPASVV